MVLEISLKSLAGPDRVQVFDLASLEFCQTWSQRNHCVIITLAEKEREGVNLKNCPPRNNLSNGPPSVSHFTKIDILIFLFFSSDLHESFQVLKQIICFEISLCCAYSYLIFVTKATSIFVQIFFGRCKFLQI